MPFDEGISTPVRFLTPRPYYGFCAVVSERRGGAAVSSRVVGRPEEGRTVGDRRREPAPRALGDPGLPLVAMLSPLLQQKKQAEEKKTEEAARRPRARKKRAKDKARGYNALTAAC